MSQADQQRIVEAAYDVIRDLEKRGFTPHSAVCVIATAATIMCSKNSIDPMMAAEDFCKSLRTSVHNVLSGDMN